MLCSQEEGVKLYYRLLLAVLSEKMGRFFMTTGFVLCYY